MSPRFTMFVARSFCSVQNGVADIELLEVSVKKTLESLTVASLVAVFSFVSGEQKPYAVSFFEPYNISRSMQFLNKFPQFSKCNVLC